VRIDIPTVLVDLRAQVVDARRGGRATVESLAMRGAAYAFTRSARLGRVEQASWLAGRLLGLVGRTTLPGGRRALGRIPGPGAAWSSARDLPVPPRESFRAWWRRTGGGLP
jgi:L-lactate dehydrogenase complex protein LldF